jgi:hypothetical protein
MADMLYRRQLPDGRWLEVIPLTYGRARITIGDGKVFIDDNW